MAETKRAPFDLPESESELVAGYLTEYSGMKFLLFWLGEFAEIVVASSLVVLLFFGGWQLPWYDIRQVPSDMWGLLPYALGAGTVVHLLIALRALAVSPLGARAWSFKLNALLTVVTAALAFGSTLVDWQALNFQWAPLIGVAVFGGKVALFCVLQVIIRWTLPRFRYDQLMALCWKIMLPICLVNVLVTAIVVLSGVSLGIFNLMLLALVIAVLASLKRA
jgi:NADH-quinone oxidoreductase subunit H